MAGADIVESLEDLCKLDSDLHWFCPRETYDDYNFYYDEDCLEVLSTETVEQRDARRSRAREAEARRDRALNASKILAFDGEDAQPYQAKYQEKLKGQMIRCDVCIREFHRARSLLKGSLAEEYDPEDVNSFMEKFDGMNTDRIARGLESAAEMLSKLPEDQRSITKAGQEGMYAMFEALNCLPFLREEDSLQRYFDRPFKMCNTRKKVKLPSFAPGMAAFLFSHNADRSAWASRQFANIKRDIVPAEFNFSIIPFLQASLARVSVNALEKDFLPVFWKAARLIISKLNSRVIANSLRTMDIDIWKIGLQHFQVNATHFTDLLISYQMLLEKAPDVFWDAMQDIPPTAVLDQIFRAPTLEQLFTVTDEREHLHLEDKLAWIDPFIRSIKPANIVSPIRTILSQLLSRFQGKKYSQYAQSVTFEKGFSCILSALRYVKDHVRGGPVVTHLIEIVAKEYIPTIISELEGIEKLQQETQVSKLQQTCLDIIEVALALDVQSLAYDRYLIEHKTTRAGDQELSISGLNVWKMGMKLVLPGQPSLPAAILGGVSGLLPLEKFAPRQIEAAERTTTAWNYALDRALGYLKQDFLERLEAFAPDQLEDLFYYQRAANGLVTLLFSGEKDVHQSVLTMLKNLSGQDSRRDSLMHLAQAFFNPAMTSFSIALKAIAKAAAFAPCLTMLKLCNDMFSCLCDSSDGILRSKSISASDASALENFWQTTWVCVLTIFEQMEPWSNRGYDRVLMQDFCRDTMDFADFAFDQYQLFATVLQDALPLGEATDAEKNLLKFPSQAFSKQVKWLRLRDDYLISKAVGLTCKMLFRLKDAGITVPKDGQDYVDHIVLPGPGGKERVRTKLSMNQKAELQRALEEHIGEKLDEVIEIEPSAAMKYKQMSISGWASSGRSTPSTPDVMKPKQTGIDIRAWSEAEKKRKASMPAVEPAALAKPDPLSKQAREVLRRKEIEAKVNQLAVRQREGAKNQNAFLEKRKKEREEAEARRAAALAKTKVGVGSGVQGVGDVGKDYSKKGQNVMVSSDEDSESEGDLDEDLFGIKRKDKKDLRRVELPNFEANGGTGLKPEQKRGPTRIHRAQRNLKDLRARLAPDLAPLHKTILKWDFFHDGDYPPGSNEAEFAQVGDTFMDPTTYQQTFQPLLVLEAWQGMVKSREENTNKPYDLKVSSRSNVDGFIEISTLVGHAENRELQLQEGDIILLSKSKKPLDDASAPNSLARISRIKRQKANLEVLYRILPGMPLAPSLSLQAVVFGVKIQSITPLEREYGALQGLQYYDLCNQIVRAKPSPRYNFSEKQINASQDNWNVNKAQAEAICAAMENEGFSLIQGPPGSGKTKTIVAIVGGLLSNVLNNATSVRKINIPQAANGSTQANGDSGSPRKLLVCAPSNAAVDELVMRLKEGVTTRNGKRQSIQVVRIGRSEAINQQVKDVTMDELVAKKLGTNQDEQKLREANAAIFKEHEKVSADLRDMLKQRDSGECKGRVLSELENSIVNARKRKNELSIKIDNAKDQERNAGREAELNRKRAQQAVLDESHVICATLSGSGHDMFQSLNIEFETVIIDEAAQCVEMSSLIPLKYGCIKCIMVGDPKQLPPTVFSKEAARFQYEQSLFVRMQNNFAKEVYLLDTQYRMHPDISVFPSTTFYDGLLKDGPGMAELRKRPWHASALLGPYRFFDVRGQHQAGPRGHSLVNTAEINMAIALYQRLTTDFKTYDFKGRVGIITPYKSQLHALKDKFAAKYGKEVFDTIEFNTTDAFQGRESEIIIFSCVRASPAGGIGFLQDIRRMNVGLTRAKSSLWVLGDSQSLVRGRYWKRLVDDAKSRDSYTTGDVKGMLSKPSSAFPAAQAKDSSMLDVREHVPQMKKGGAGGGRDSSNTVAKGLARPGFETGADPVQASPSSAMEGVRYRFADRVKGKKAGGVAGYGSERAASPSTSASGQAPQAVSNEDAEMGDAGSVYSDAATAASGAPSTNGERPRSETPSAKARATNNASGGHSSGATAKAAATSQPPQPVVRKRPAANPFITNNKRPKPR